MNMMSSSMEFNKDIQLENVGRRIHGCANLTGGSSTLVVFDKLETAEAALRSLRASGFDMNNLSVVAKEFYDGEPQPGCYRLDGEIISWSRKGVFWGWVLGLLFGSAFIFIPGIGPVMAGGPIVGWLIEAFETSLFVGGLSALGAALLSRGLNKDQVIKAENALKSSKQLLVVHGAESEIRKVKTILDTGERL
jgi:hypothetical protein